jgi:GABA(A) receptor-associated protein
MDDFKNKFTEKYRITECERIKNKYPNRIPIIVCKDKNCKLVNIDKQKFLVPKDMNMGQFIYIIRKRISLESSEALFVLVNHHLIPGNNVLDEVYEKHKDKDGFLYVSYTSENTFG